MIKLKSLLDENITPHDITIRDIQTFASKRISRDVERTLETLISYYSSENPDLVEEAKKYINLLNKVLHRIYSIIKNLNIPHVDDRLLREYLLSQTEFFFKEDDFFPFPLYISSGPNDEGTIGVLVDSNGKVLEIHEGHDEASPETTAMVNKMINPNGKKVRIYASHDRNLCFKIQEKDMLPPNLFVSPDRRHAESHKDLEGKRETFTGIIDINLVNQDSDLDWKTMGNTPIANFRFI